MVVVVELLAVVAEAMLLHLLMISAKSFHQPNHRVTEILYCPTRRTIYVESLCANIQSLSTPNLSP